MEQRNWAGLALIDRNDELCVLYERSHVQEQVLLHAEINLRSRDDEIRMLKIELTEAQRALEARGPGPGLSSQRCGPSGRLGSCCDRRPPCPCYYLLTTDRLTEAGVFGLSSTWMADADG